MQLLLLRGIYVINACLFLLARSLAQLLVIFVSSGLQLIFTEAELQP